MITNTSKCNHIRLLNTTGGGTSKEVLKELASYAMQEGFAKEGYEEALLQREEEFPTGIQAQQGIAIPHADQQYTRKGAIIIAILDEEAQFHEMCTKHKLQVKIVFLLLIPHVDHQVKVLENIVTLIQDEEKMQALQNSNAIAMLAHMFESYV